MFFIIQKLVFQSYSRGLVYLFVFGDEIFNSTVRTFRKLKLELKIESAIFALRYDIPSMYRFSAS